MLAHHLMYSIHAGTREFGSIARLLCYARLQSCAKAGHVPLLQTGNSYKALVVIGAGLNCFLLGSWLRAAWRANVSWVFASGALRAEIPTIGRLWRLKAVWGKRNPSSVIAGIGKSLLSHA